MNQSKNQNRKQEGSYKAEEEDYLNTSTNEILIFIAKMMCLKNIDKSIYTKISVRSENPILR